MKTVKACTLVVTLALTACHDEAQSTGPSPARIMADAPALDALRGARFADAAKYASQQLAITPHAAYAGNDLLAAMHKPW
jgi:hypothetical protein